VLLSFLGRLRIGLIKTSYMAKIMAVAFLGIHIPLLTLLASFVLSTTYSQGKRKKNGSMTC
jgi:hypothetical protein